MYLHAQAVVQPEDLEGFEGLDFLLPPTPNDAGEDMSLSPKYSGLIAGTETKVHAGLAVFEQVFYDPARANSQDNIKDLAQPILRPDPNGPPAQPEAAFHRYEMWANPGTFHSRWTEFMADHAPSPDTGIIDLVAMMEQAVLRQANGAITETWFETPVYRQLSDKIDLVLQGYGVQDPNGDPTTFAYSDGPGDDVDGVGFAIPGPTIRLSSTLTIALGTQIGDVPLPSWMNQTSNPTYTISAGGTGDIRGVGRYDSTVLYFQYANGQIGAVSGKSGGAGLIRVTVPPLAPLGIASIIAISNPAYGYNPIEPIRRPRVFILP